MEEQTALDYDDKEESKEEKTSSAFHNELRHEAAVSRVLGTSTLSYQLPTITSVFSSAILQAFAVFMRQMTSK